MKNPPLEMFHWDRVVVDEFQYIIDNGNTARSRVKTIVLGLESNFKWGLSGTPPHENFNDVKMLADLLGINLGINDNMYDGRQKRGGAMAAEEKTQLEKFNSLMDIKSTSWHLNRHRHAQR